MVRTTSVRLATVASSRRLQLTRRARGQVARPPDGGGPGTRVRPRPSCVPGGRRGSHLYVPDVLPARDGVNAPVPLARLPGNQFRGDRDSCSVFRENVRRTWRARLRTFRWNGETNPSIWVVGPAIRGRLLLGAPRLPVSIPGSRVWCRRSGRPSRSVARI